MLQSYEILNSNSRPTRRDEGLQSQYQEIVFKIAEIVKYRGLLLGSSLRNLKREWDGILSLPMRDVFNLCLNDKARKTQLHFRVW